MKNTWTATRSLISKYPLKWIYLLLFSEKLLGSLSTPHRIRTLIIKASPEAIRGKPQGLAWKDCFLQNKNGVRDEKFTVGFSQSQIFFHPNVMILILNYHSNKKSLAPNWFLLLNTKNMQANACSLSSTDAKVGPSFVQFTQCCPSCSEISVSARFCILMPMTISIYRNCFFFFTWFWRTENLST